MSEFFSGYPAFYTTYHSANRLNKRYNAIFGSNIELLKGARILDIASNDGRWSFAALTHGASSILGVEGRPHYVETAKRWMQKYEINPSRYSFINGDIHEELPKLAPGRFDIVFCLGFFYHTAHHFSMLSELKRLRAKHIFLDTQIVLNESPVVEFGWDDPADERDALPGPHHNGPNILIGRASKSAIEMMLGYLGYTWKYYDWQSGAIDDWTDLQWYQEGRRITLVASAQGA